MNHRGTEKRVIEENRTSDAVIGAAIEVHRALGPGLLINFNVPVLRQGVKRMVNGYL